MNTNNSGTLVFRYVRNRERRVTYFDQGKLTHNGEEFYYCRLGETLPYCMGTADPLSGIYKDGKGILSAQTMTSNPVYAMWLDYKFVFWLTVYTLQDYWERFKLWQGS